MNPTQIILAVIGSVAAFFVGLREIAKWALSEWKSSAADNRDVQRQTTIALIDNTRSNAELRGQVVTLATTVDALGRKIDGIGTFIVEEMTPVNSPIPRRTPAGGVAVNPGGYSLGRQRTQGDR